MRKAWALPLALSLVLSGCVGGGSPAPDATVRSSSTAAGSPRPTPSSLAAPSIEPTGSRPAVQRLPAITLVGDMSQRPEHWIPVMFVPFGPASDEAGALLTKKLASQPVVPPSFAVDRDGSLWLLDLVKHRIEHFGPTGRFLSVIGGLQFNRFRPYAQDLGFVGDQLYVAEFTHNTLQTYVRAVSAAGIGRRVRVESNGRPLFVSHLVGPGDEMTGYSNGSSGVAGQPIGGGGESGYQVVDPESGASRTVNGILMADGSRLGTGRRLIDNGRALSVVHQADGRITRRLLRLEVRPTTESDVRIPVVAGWETYVALPDGFATYMGFSPVRRVDQDRYHGSDRWLLEYFEDGTPLVWEPLPESTLKGAYVWRYLAEGLDGHLYLMLAEKGGMRIYRRPGPSST